MGLSDASKLSTEHVLVIEKSSHCEKRKEEKREGQACPGCSDILKGTVFGPPPTPLTGLGCRGSEDAALPFRLNSVPERAHVDFLFVNGHHVHVTPALVPDDSCMHGGPTDA